MLRRKLAEPPSRSPSPRTTAVTSRGTGPAADPRGPRRHRRRSAYTYRPRTVPAEGRVRALCVASLQEYKGHAVLFDALAGPGSSSAWSSTSSGAGPLRAELERRAQRARVVAARALRMAARPEDDVRRCSSAPTCSCCRASWRRRADGGAPGGADGGARVRRAGGGHPPSRACPSSWTDGAGPGCLPLRETRRVSVTPSSASSPGASSRTSRRAGRSSERSSTWRAARPGLRSCSERPGGPPASNIVQQGRKKPPAS